MTSKNLRSAIWLTLIASAVALAAPGGGKGPPSDKGNKPTSEVGNNLSVPTIMVGGKGAFAALACDAEQWTLLTRPTKDPVPYPADCATTQDGGQYCVAAGDYFVQRDGTWQAPCFLATSTPITVEGAWGDNLGGDAQLKVGSPIRVELVLWDATTTGGGQQGYKVIKLEPAELDRESDYGHLALGSEGAWDPIPTDVGVIVHDPSAMLRIERIVDGVPVSPPVFQGTAGAEINATGKIVYGHNLRVQLAGTYRITYTISHVSFDHCDIGDCAASAATLDIEVVGGGGGGGGGKPGRP